MYSGLVYLLHNVCVHLIMTIVCPPPASQQMMSPQTWHPPHPGIPIQHTGCVHLVQISNSYGVTVKIWRGLQLPLPPTSYTNSLLKEWLVW